MRTFLASSSSFALLAATVLACGAGCGQLEGDPDQAPIIATIRGQLANPDSYAAGANMRVAIVWGGDTGALRVSQDVPVQPVFPSQFKLDLRSLPPQDAMLALGEDENKPNRTDCTQGWDPSSGKPQPAPNAPCDTDEPPLPGPGPSPTPAPGGTRIQSDDDFRVARPGDTFKVAIGSLVAYEDLNGNGQLDLLDDQATTAIDRVVGVNEDLYVVYVEGTPQGDFAQLNVPKGFSQVSIGRPKPCTETADVGGNEPAIPTTDGGARPVPMPTVCENADPSVLPIETVFTLPLTASARFTDFMCRGESSTIGVGMASPPPIAQGENAEGYYPAPTDPKLRCKADGSGYTYTPCESSQNLCGDRIECSSITVARPSSVPANWPCATP